MKLLHQNAVAVDEECLRGNPGNLEGEPGVSRFEL